MLLDNNGITFETTGRHVYAHAAIIGIDPALAISYGYDGGFYAPGWTKEEHTELANYMIGLWTEYRRTRGTE